MLDPQHVLVCQHVEFLSHVLQSHVDLKKVSLPANQNAFKLLNQILSLLEDHPQHAQGRGKKLVTFVDREFKERQNHGFKRGHVFTLTLEEVPVFAHVVRVLRVMIEGSQFLEFVAPNADLLHDILIFADLPYFSQDSGILVLVELFFGCVISGQSVNFSNWVLFFLLVVVIEILGGLIQSLEKVHHISESDIDFQLVHEFKYFCSFGLAVNVQSVLGSVETEAFLVGLHHFKRSFLVSVDVEQLIVFDLYDAHDQQGDQLSETRNALPKSELHGFLEK